eukprot:CAMPEP_0116135032 /NCGR_PEP_ID=MMETSP0329-20121206/10975_1 /TAXON_ID=697910 /ORGANISM="Pseudo-nitzschia arenysensis, Strain B593" /LENGTH=86 /DNA_ID=CAMNT_0003629807 /DNA_START=136 /DNA_END=397 /DNA_ORIENTATION=-
MIVIGLLRGCEAGDTTAVAVAVAVTAFATTEEEDILEGAFVDAGEGGIEEAEEDDCDAFAGLLDGLHMRERSGTDVYKSVFVWLQC